MKILKIEKGNAILYKGLVEGVEGIYVDYFPGGIDSSLENEIECTKITEYVEEYNKRYAISVFMDKEGNIIYNDIIEI